MEVTKQIIDWRGYKIEVTCDAKTYDLTRHKGPNMIHIELHTLEPEKAPLPVTETGYRSHFIHAELVSEYESPTAFVQAWLDHAAKDSSWQKAAEAVRQLSLF